MLAYTMNKTYMSYFFAPLLSTWFVVVYGTMLVGARFNHRPIFLTLKIFVSAALMAWFVKARQPLELTFLVLGDLFAIRWPAREWGDHLENHLWVVYVGMLSAVALSIIRERRWNEHVQWPMFSRAFTGLAAVVMVGYFAVVAKYSIPHVLQPYISPVVIVAYAILRNSTPNLRSKSSWALALVGRCALEIYILHHHMWLAGDGRGVLLIIPGARWSLVNLALTTMMLLYTAHMVTRATRTVTGWVCTESNGGGSTSSPSISDFGDDIPLIAYKLALDSGSHPNGWVDDGSDEKDEGDHPLTRLCISINTCSWMASCNWTSFVKFARRLPAIVRPRLEKWLNDFEEWMWSIDRGFGMKCRLAVFLLVLWLVNAAWT